MLKSVRTAALSVAVACTAITACQAGNPAGNPNVGGAPMFETKNIIQNAVNSKDHTTLVAAVKAAFAALPAGTLETLKRPENKDQLVKILTCHVVAARALSGDINKMVFDDGGTHPVNTVGGCEFTALEQNGKILIIDGKGNVATVTIADVRQSNGVIHVIDKVLLPAS